MPNLSLEELKREVQITPLYDTIQCLDMSDEEYFSSKYAHYISNSRLSLINPDQDGSPEKYLKGFDTNNIASDSLYFGTAIHQTFLQPDEFYVVPRIFRPTAKLGFVLDDILKNRAKGMSILDSIYAASNNINYYKGKITDKIIKHVLKEGYKYYLGVTHHKKKEGKEPIFLSAKDHVRHAACIESLSTQRKIQNILNPTYLFDKPLIKNESVLLMDIQVTYKEETFILKLKSKLDNWILDFESETLYLNDLKTTGYLLLNFKESWEKYHYYRQMGMYWWMLTAYVKATYNKPFIGKANMFVVSTVPNYYSQLFQVTKDEIKRGMDEFSHLIRLAAITEYETRIFDQRSTI